MIRKQNIITSALFLAGIALAAAGADDPAVPYPQGYRRWAHLHSTFIGPKHVAFAERACEKPCTGGAFYFYGNDKAMEGFRTGKFPEGSVIADEVLEILGDEKGNGREGPRRGVGVMVKDTKLYSATGGWGYGRFVGDSKVEASTAKEKQECFACHAPKKDHDYVFTEYRER